VRGEAADGRGVRSAPINGRPTLTRPAASSARSSEDDGCDPDQAVVVANELAAEEVAVVIGHVCSASSISASNVCAEKHIIEISPASTNPKFTDEHLGIGIMRVCGHDDQQGRTAGEFVAWRFKDDRSRSSTT
jgi:ABC-type branched-subunit amino acid transport system substrate-binding protein